MRRAVFVGVLFTAAAGVVVVLLPAHSGQVVRGWLIGVAALAAVSAARAVAPLPPDPERAPLFARRIQPVRPQGPEDLQAIRLALDLAGSSEFDLHHRLRPLFLETADALLLTRRRVDLLRTPDRARALVGPDLWDLIRPDRPEPPGRGRRELEPERLEGMVASLEDLAR